MTSDTGMYVVNVAKKLKMGTTIMMERIMTNYGKINSKEMTDNMFPVINLRETGVNLHRIIDKREITPKDIKEFLNLGSIQTVYNWCNGLNMPIVDNLYALSQLLQVLEDKVMMRGIGNERDF